MCCINPLKAELLKRKTGGDGVRRKKSGLEGEITGLGEKAICSKASRPRPLVLIAVM
jgi:hypothetical protein